MRNAASDTIGGAMLTWDWQCSSLRLPIGIHYGAVCGCEYPSDYLFLVCIDVRICWLYGPNLFPNSMFLNLFWTIGILDSYYCGWSINVLGTFCNSICLVILILMWKGTKGQSMIAYLFSSHNAQTLESNLIISESTYSWFHFSVVYLVWSNYRFPWCDYDCGISSNAFIYTFTYSNDFG